MVWMEKPSFATGTMALYLEVEMTLIFAALQILTTALLALAIHTSAQ